MNQPRLIWDGVRVKGDRPLEFWYVRRSFAAAKVAVEKGMIPIFGILNQTYSNWIKSQNDALEFQEANGGCTIAMVQQFWGRETFALDTIRPIAETTNGRPLTMYGGIYCTSAGKRNQELIDHANL